MLRRKANQDRIDINHHASIVNASQNADRETKGTTTAEVSVAQPICEKLCSDDVAPLGSGEVSRMRSVALGSMSALPQQ